ncbi:hypothetical protein H8E88_11545 [candidate division KSB1 bacterium]|nr:hypothetical protein [candidate division KSB1 bacterium]MBL7095771.1 hypothetical protein [candidate division KSB1 bacterium]
MRKVTLFTTIFFLVLLAACQKDENPLSYKIEPYKVINNFWQPVTEVPGQSIYTITSDSDGNLYIGTNIGLYRSSDFGNSWEKISDLHPIQNIYISPYHNIKIIGVSGHFGTFTHYSIDGGSTWLTPTISPHGSIRQFIMLPTGEIFAGTWFHDESAGGLYMSPDTCKTWEFTTLGPGFSIKGLALNSNNDLYAALWHRNTDSILLFFSNTQGESWSEITRFDSSRNISTVLINNRNEIIISSNKGIIISRDYGESWESIGLEQYELSTYLMAIDNKNNLIVEAYGEFNSPKIFLLLDSYDTWYALEGLSVLRDIYAIVIGLDRHIYVVKDYELYKSKEPIDTVLN